jgi:hypothetical protein
MVRAFSIFLFPFLFSGALGMTAIQVPQSSLAEPKNGHLAEDEIVVMGHLMENTSQQLEIQKQMRQLMRDFREQKDEFAAGNQTKSHAARMVRTARQIYESIIAHHLEYLFSKEYLEELLFFSSIAGKNRIKGV